MSSHLATPMSTPIEGALTWIEADQIIREGTKGKKGLDDFAKAFFGVNDGDWGQLTYDFDEIVDTLNGVYPYDWADFLTTRLLEPDQPAPPMPEEAGPSSDPRYASRDIAARIRDLWA